MSRGEDRAAEARRHTQAALVVVEQGQLPGRAMVRDAVQRAVDAAQLEDTDDGMAALAVSLGQAVDVGTHMRDPYGVAAAARELRETLIRLGLDPASRSSRESDELATLLGRMGTPS